MFLITTNQLTLNLALLIMFNTWIYIIISINFQVYFFYLW